jgi:N-acetylmuramoyl-L-alanine amidase
VIPASALLTACSRGSSVSADAGFDMPALAERARAVVDGKAPLEQRSDVLALAESVESGALREGAGARAVALHSLAARVLERVFRIEGREQDAKEAILLFRTASRDLSIEGACESAERAAWLAGDLAHDAAVTYAELYRVERRMAGPAKPEGTPEAGAPSPLTGPGAACAAEIDHSLTAMSSFRPPAQVLESIEQGLAGEGDVPLATIDAASQATESPQIVRIEPLPGKDAARVVVALSRPSHFRSGDETNAETTPGGASLHTFVELDGVDVGAAPRDVAMAGIITHLRAEPTSTGTRVTLDLDGPAYKRVFYLPEPYRIIIDIARHPPGTARSRRVVERIVLDPGHGGNDPGAIGPDGVREKEVTLDIAHKVAPLLLRDGLVVVLTRDDDRFVPLEERTARANAFGADLFVSIHCNAAENHARHGIETYILDTTNDEIASRVAARENATSQAATAELGSILASLRMADQASHSLHLAELMQKAAVASTRDRYRDAFDGGVHTAGFYVLVGARMPSILLETGYISNPIEEQRLENDDYRQRIADAIVNAVRAYRQGR